MRLFQKKIVFLAFSTLLSCSIFSQASKNNNDDEMTPQSFLDTYLKENDAPDFVSKYIHSLDTSLKDVDAHIYFRRFIADTNTRQDNLIRFVEYLSLAGYPNSLIIDNNFEKNIAPIDIYKAVYFANTYSIMEGIPTGPMYQKE
jgi:hypothetical protein